MNRKLPDITESPRTERPTRYASESVGYKKQRLTAVYLLQSGGAKNRKQVADLIGVNRKTVGQWLDAYQAGGIEQMLDRRYPPGRSPLLSEAQTQALRAELDKPSGFSSYGQIQQFIASSMVLSGRERAIRRFNRWFTINSGKTESPPQKSSKKNEQLNEAFVLTFQEQVETAILLPVLISHTFTMS